MTASSLACYLWRWEGVTDLHGFQVFFDLLLVVFELLFFIMIFTRKIIMIFTHNDIHTYHNDIHAKNIIMFPDS